MKKAVLLFVSLFLLAMTSFGEEAEEQYGKPLEYGIASIFPGMGQALLGEPKKGALIFLSSVGSLGVAYGGLVLLMPNATIDPNRETEQSYKKKQVLASTGAGLILAGAIGWAATEIYSVTNAISMAKQKRAEITLAPTVLPTGVTYAAGLSLALRF